MTYQTETAADLMKRSFPDGPQQEAAFRRGYADGSGETLAFVEELAQRMGYRAAIEACFAHHEKLMEWAHNGDMNREEAPPAPDFTRAAARRRRQKGAAG